RAIVKADNRLPENLKPKDITERALADSCTDCRRALSLFCVIMGRFGGNLALTLGTFGGVYIAGGIVPRFLEFFKASGFRDNPGLLGSGAHLRQTLGHIL
ncbi:MAG: glucokinase, partial [Escherichia coli]|nr:glucokinase [Escherichia coli]